MKLEHLCKKPVASVDVDDSIVAAARTMREYHVGDVLVTDTGSARPVGILTDRDIVVALAAPGIDFELVKVSDVMSSELVVAQHDETVEDALQRMADHGIRRMPVVLDDEVCVGILSLDDLIVHLSRQTHLMSRVIARQLDREWRERP